MPGLDDFLSQYGMLGAGFDPTIEGALPELTNAGQSAAISRMPLAARRGMMLAKKQEAFDSGQRRGGGLFAPQTGGAFKPDPGTFGVRPGTFSVQPGEFAVQANTFAPMGGTFMPTGSTQQRQAMSLEKAQAGSESKLGML